MCLATRNDPLGARVDRSPLQDHMAVRAGDPEPADAGETRLPGLVPRREGARDLAREVPPGNVGVGLAIMEAGRDRAMVQRECRLDQPGGPGGPFGVADIRL